MGDTSNSLFLALFIGMVVTGAALILSIPPLFGPHEPHQARTTGVLGGLSLAFAVGTLHSRPRRPRPTDRNADE